MRVQQCFVRTLSVVVALFVVGPLAWGQCEVHLTASDSAAEDQFGRTVAMSGDVAVIGAPHNDDAGPSSGAAYVYRFDGTSWFQQQKLVASDAATGDEFGRAVAVSGNTIVVGAPLEDAAGVSAGAAYVFRFDGGGWIQEQKLIASDAFAFDQCGESVAAHGDVIVVGAPNAHSPDPAGIVYVYRNNGSSWAEDQILTASDGVGYDNFGVSVSAAEDLVVVGADDTDASTGSAYVYEYNGSTWIQEQILTAADGAPGDEFGHSVSASGDAIAIGAPRDDFSTGAAYVFRRGVSSWFEEQKVSGEFGFDKLGSSVAIDGGYLAAGAPTWGGPDGAGRAFGYRYESGTWILERELGDNAFAFDSFGFSIAVSTSAILVGSPFGDDGGFFETGAADVFGRPAIDSFRNGDFADTSGDPWCFVDRSENGAVSFGAADAEVTGGDDGSSGNTITYVEQAFDLHTESNYRVTFDWTYSSIDSPGYDGAFYDVIDARTGQSLVGWAVTLSDTDGASGTASVPFSGSGQYVLRLGTFSSDNLFGPGISTFDNVEIACDEPAGALTNGDFADASGVPWCFSDTSRNGAADFVAGEAVVSGSNDGVTIDSATFLEQEISVGSGSQTCAFDWAYSSGDSPGYDAAVWDLIDMSTGLSVVSGPVTLSDTAGESGTVATSFTGSGLYRLRLGVTSTDSIFGAGRLTVDDVVIGSAAPSFVRGDANTDGGFDISDAVFLLDFLFSGGVTPPCTDSADANDDGTVNLGDPVTILDRLFAGGAPIPAPHPSCGPDPTADGIGCASFPACP